MPGFGPPPNIAQIINTGTLWPGTYRAGTTGQTFYSTAAAVLAEITGSATKTVKIWKLTIWGQAATKFYTELQLLRCTAVSASGGATALNLGQHDNTDPAPTAVINSYAAAALAGAGNKVIGAQPLSMTVPSATLEMLPTVWDFTREKPITLRGTGDVLEVFNTVTGFGAGTWGYEVEWTEDNS